MYNSERADIIEAKLDEADEAAAASDVRYSAVEMFKRTRERIKQHI